MFQFDDVVTFIYKKKFKIIGKINCDNSTLLEVRNKIDSYRFVQIKRMFTLENNEWKYNKFETKKQKQKDDILQIKEKDMILLKRRFIIEI